MEGIELKALKFAYKAHDGQLRKYTKEPYITHPITVAGILKEYDFTGDVIVAALLHDTVEDTDVTIEDIEKNFGKNVARLVNGLTDASIQPQHKDKNRKERTLIDRDHLASGCPAIQTVKYADLIHNTSCIVADDKHFAKRYLREKIAVIGVMEAGDTRLRDRAIDQVFKNANKLELIEQCPICTRPGYYDEYPPELHGMSCNVIVGCNNEACKDKNIIGFTVKESIVIWNRYSIDTLREKKEKHLKSKK